MSEFECRNCGEGWNGAYNCEHRCTTCGAPLSAVDTDTRLERAEEEIERLRLAIRSTRLYAGEHLPAAVGLTVVNMLEQALRR
nr:hypothetical protein [uncultured Halomonas sp.]